MTDALGWIGRLGGSLAILAAVAATWWSADDGARHPLAASGGGSGAAVARAFLRRTLGPDLPVARFLRNVAGCAALALAVFLIAYFMAVPAFFRQMAEDDFARLQVLKYLVLYVVPPVLVATFASFSAQGATLERLARAPLAGRLLRLLLDGVVRLAAFALVSALSLWLMARSLERFGGSIVEAVVAFGEAMRGGLVFANLAGVAFYATVLGGFPAFILVALAAVDRSPALRRTRDAVDRLLPVSGRPVRFAGLVVGATLAVFAFAMASAIHTLAGTGPAG